MRFIDKVALVTGGNFGIGRAIALQPAHEGAEVVIVARNKTKGSQVKDELLQLSGAAEFFSTDLCSESNVSNVVNSVINRFKRLDVVINNAECGSQHCGISEEDSAGKRWHFFRGANLDFTYYVSAYTLPFLSKTENSAIVNISSTATFHGN